MYTDETRMAAAAAAGERFLAADTIAGKVQACRDAEANGYEIRCANAPRTDGAKFTLEPLRQEPMLFSRLAQTDDISRDSLAAIEAAFGVKLNL